MDRANGSEDHGRRVGQVARGVGVGTIGQGIGRFMVFTIQLILARMLGPALFGAYVLGTTIVSLANILSQLGMNNGVVRWVSHYRSEGDDARVKGTIIQALAITFLLSVALGAAMFFTAGLMAEHVFDRPFEKEFVEKVFKILSFSIPFVTLMSMALWATQGLQVVRYSAYVEHVYRPVLNIALILVAYWLGAPVFGAAGAYVLSMAMGSAVALWYLWRLFPKIADRQVPAVFETRDLFRVSAPMIVASFMRHLNMWTSTLVVGAFITTGATAIYNSAARTALLASVIIVAFNAIFSPMIAQLYRRNQMAELDLLYKDVSRWSFMANLVFFLSTVLLARDVMSVFGPKFVEGWPVLIVIAGAQMFSASVGSTGRILAMTDRQHVVMYATVGTVVLNLLLNFLLVPLYGIVGSAFATAIAMAATNVVTLAAVRRSLGLWPYTPRYLKPVVAGVLAVAAAYLFRLLVPLEIGVVAVFVVGAVYLAAFAGALILLGLEPSDRQFIEAFWNAVLRKVRLKPAPKEPL